MADETPPTGAASSVIDGVIGGPGAPAENARLRCVTQYVKDLSFESPGSPTTVLQGDEEPHGDLRVQVTVRKLGGEPYEVILQFQVEGGGRFGIHDRNAVIIGGTRSLPEHSQVVSLSLHRGNPNSLVFREGVAICIQFR